MGFLALIPIAIEVGVEAGVEIATTMAAEIATEASEFSLSLMTEAFGEEAFNGLFDEGVDAASNMAELDGSLSPVAENTTDIMSDVSPEMNDVVENVNNPTEAAVSEEQNLDDLTENEANEETEEEGLEDNGIGKEDVADNTPTTNDDAPETQPIDDAPATNDDIPETQPTSNETANAPATNDDVPETQPIDDETADSPATNDDVPETQATDDEMLETQTDDNETDDAPTTDDDALETQTADDEADDASETQTIDDEIKDNETLADDNDEENSLDEEEYNQANIWEKLTGEDANGDPLKTPLSKEELLEKLKDWLNQYTQDAKEAQFNEQFSPESLNQTYNINPVSFDIGNTGSIDENIMNWLKDARFASNDPEIVESPAEYDTNSLNANSEMSDGTSPQLQKLFGSIKNWLWENKGHIIMNAAMMGIPMIIQENDENKQQELQKQQMIQEAEAQDEMMKEQTLTSAFTFFSRLVG